MTLLTAGFVVLLFVLVRSADIAIVAGRANDVVRVICYGFVAILAIIVAVISAIH